MRFHGESDIQLIQYSHILIFLVGAILCKVSTILTMYILLSCIVYDVCPYKIISTKEYGVKNMQGRISLNIHVS